MALALDDQILKVDADHAEIDQSRDALHSTALTELADDQGPQTVIGVGNGPTTDVSGFRERAGRQGSDDAGKEFTHPRILPHTGKLSNYPLNGEGSSAMAFWLSPVAVAFEGAGRVHSAGLAAASKQTIQSLR